MHNFVALRKKYCVRRVEPTARPSSCAQCQSKDGSSTFHLPSGSSWLVKSWKALPLPLPLHLLL